MMSWQEGYIHITFVVVDPAGLQEFRQGPHLYPTFTIFFTENLLRE